LCLLCRSETAPPVKPIGNSKTRFNDSSENGTAANDIGTRRHYRLRLRRMLAMYRFAAALPFTSRAGRFVLRRLRLPAAATFFFDLRRRFAALRKPPLRPARWNMA